MTFFNETRLGAVGSVGSIALLSLATLLAGCTSETLELNVDAGQRQDAEAVDSGPSSVDAGDASTSDAATVPEAGVAPDAGPWTCVDGAEGCACTGANRNPESKVLVRGSCAPDLLCVPWDRFAIDGRTGPVSTCVKPCANDEECRDPWRGERACNTSFPLGPSSEPISICVDALETLDRACGGSRLSEAYDRPPPEPDDLPRTPETIVGCAEGTCSLGLPLPHSDEGVCVELCQSDADCPAARGFCNANAFASLNRPTVTVPNSGICSPIAPIPAGELCQVGLGVFTFGLLTLCDNSDAELRLTCLPMGPVNACVETCMANDPCREQAGHTVRCRDFADGFDGWSLCSVGCENTPDNCEGPGRFGDGRYCLGRDGIANVAVCSSRGPEWTLSKTFFDATGSALAVMGDNCMARDRFARCPEPTHCVELEPWVGGCATGCDLSAPGRGGCEALDAEIVGTATCTPAIQDESGVRDRENGLCGIQP